MYEVVRLSVITVKVSIVLLVLVLQGRSMKRNSTKNLQKMLSCFLFKVKKKSCQVFIRILQISWCLRSSGKYHIEFFFRKNQSVYLCFSIKWIQNCIKRYWRFMKSRILESYFQSHIELMIAGRKLHLYKEICSQLALLFFWRMKHPRTECLFSARRSLWELPLPIIALDSYEQLSRSK